MIYYRSLLFVCIITFDLCIVLAAIGDGYSADILAAR